MTATADSYAGVARSAAVRSAARDSTIDTMRGVAILMVIGIHSLPRIDGSALVTAIDSVLRPCVPMFLFASGMLTVQLGRVPLAKRVRRTLGPYTIAFVAAYAFMAATNPHMDHRPVVLAARYLLAYVFVYYYVFVYVGCTVALWLVFRAAAIGKGDARQRALLLFALAIPAGLAVGAYIDPLLQRLGVADAVIEEIRMRDVPFWFAFTAAGALVGGLKLRPALHALRYALAAAAAIAYLAYAGVRIAHVGDAADYDSVAFFLYATLFTLAMVGFAGESRGLAVLGSASYFIYLWHIFIVMILRRYPVLQEHPAISFPVEFAAALAASAAAVAVIRRTAGPRLVQWLGA